MQLKSLSEIGLTGDAFLERACERNASVELHHINGNSATPVAKARLIDLTDDELITDKPQTIGRAVKLHTGMDLDAFVAFGGTIVRFRSSVIDADAMVQINMNRRERGLRLVRPVVLDVSQRRSDFRRSLSAREPGVRVRFVEASEIDGACSIDARRFEGTLADASPSGLGVVLGRVKQATFEPYARWYADIDVPGEREPAGVLCEIRQTRELTDGRDTRVGVLILPWPSPRAVRRTLNPFVRFLGQVEREMLSKQHKRAG